jgi:hypothetical protein
MTNITRHFKDFTTAERVIFRVKLFAIDALRFIGFNIPLQSDEVNVFFDAE